MLLHYRTGIFGTGEKANLVNIFNHVSHIFSQFRSYRSGDFISGSNINSRENLLVFIPTQHITGHVQQVKLMHLIRNPYFVMRSVNTLQRCKVYLPDSSSQQPLLNDFWCLITKLSQLLDGFLPFPQVTKLVVNTLEFIHFGKTRSNTQERSHMLFGISFS